MKTYILGVALVLLAGCASIKKTETTKTVTTDSIRTESKDTASKTVQVQRSKDLELTDFTFHVQYASGDTVTRTIPSYRVKKIPKAPQSIYDSEIAEALAELNPDHSAIVSIDGHIGDIRELTDYSSKTDSQGVKTSGTVQIKHTDAETVKTKSVLRIPVGVFIIAGLVLLLVIGVWAVKKFML
jgi:hypothetical protein